MFCGTSIDRITIKKRSLIFDISDRLLLTVSSSEAYSSNESIE
jgi:hypothetical protein